MNAQMQRILASKQAERARLAALPFAAKLAILERLRDRTLAVESSTLYRTRGTLGGRAGLVRETAFPGAQAGGTKAVKGSATPDEIVIVEGREAGGKKAPAATKPAKSAAKAKRPRKSVLTEDPELA